MCRGLKSGEDKRVLEIVELLQQMGELLSSFNIWPNYSIGLSERQAAENIIVEHKVNGREW